MYVGPTPNLQALSFILEIETIETTNQLLLHAGPLERYDRTVDEFFKLSHNELTEPGFVGNDLTLVSMRTTRRAVTDTRRTYKTRKGFFTVAEVVKIIEKFERIDRPKSEWFGGIDCHHIFFEGIHQEAGNSFYVRWGS
jgi:hypothetical protein